jgi:hypothetical protein
MGLADRASVNPRSQLSLRLIEAYGTKTAPQRAERSGRRLRLEQRLEREAVRRCQRMADRIGQGHKLAD